MQTHSMIPVRALSTPRQPPAPNPFVVVPEADAFFVLRCLREWHPAGRFYLQAHAKGEPYTRIVRVLTTFAKAM